MPAGDFFPRRGDRVVLDFVGSGFPFPIAITYDRLQAALDDQDPVAAAWRLRDAFECLIKLTSSLAIADFLDDSPDPRVAEEVVRTLFRPMALGDWFTLLGKALKPLDPLARAGKLGESRRRLAGLHGVFFKARGGGPSTIGDHLAGKPSSFIGWRNRVFGHGVFRQERGWYAGETLRFLGPLHECLAALQPILERWDLVGDDPEGTPIIWRGTRGLPPTPPHRHSPWGPPRPMAARPRDGSGGSPLRLGPLLSVQECAYAGCRQPAAFFFDGHERKKDRHRTFFLEYFAGQPADFADWPESVELADRLPADYVWERSAWDSRDAIEGVETVFRDFDREYTRPAHLLDAIWRAIDDRPGGYIHLTGPEGIGKSYVARGLEQDGRSPEHDTPVLRYHIRPGSLGDYRTFLAELSDRARERLDFRTQEIQARVARFSELPDQFVAFLRTLMEANNLGTLVVVLDALDELHPPESDSTAWITDFLPTAEDLPDRCFVVLTSREAVHPRVRSRLDLLSQAGPDGFLRLDAGPESTANRELIRSYLRANLPEPFRTEATVEAVLDRAGGVFLYAAHLAHALASGVFPDVAALPEAHEFYPAYLARLRERAGQALFESVYRPTLALLAAARQPVTLAQLHRWGVPPGRLQFALFDLADFLRVHRQPAWHDSLDDDQRENRYAIAHEAFVRFLREQRGEWWVGAHAAIARTALPPSGSTWEDLDAANLGAAQIYDLRFVLAHLRDAGRDEEYHAAREDEGYARLCRAVGNRADHLRRHLIALDLHDQALSVYDHLVHARGRSELASHLAYAVGNKGVAMLHSGRLAEAVSRFDEAIAILRDLVEARGRPELANDLANALMNKGATLDSLGRLTESVSCYDHAIAILGDLVEERGRPELASHLAYALGNKGVALGSLGRLTESVSCYDHAIAILGDLVEERGRPELANDLAGTLMNKGVAMFRLGRLAEAVSRFDEAIAILRDLVESRGRPELANDLANALMNKGKALQGLGRLTEAVPWHDEAIAILRDLVESRGRSELTNDLANALINKGGALGSLGHLAEAVTRFDEAIAILRDLVESRGRSELTNDLANAMGYKLLTTLRLTWELPEADRAELDAALGDDAVPVRRLIGD